MRFDFLTRQVALAMAMATGMVIALQAADAVGNVFDGVYVVTVAAGETNSLSAADATAAKGYPLAKRGAGVLKSDANMAEFAGEIRIEEGIMLLSGKGGLGTGAGGTVVSNGAALHLADSSDNIRLATGSVDLAICGSGPDGQGALRNTGTENQRRMFNNGGSLVLFGDATIGGSANLGLSSNSKPDVRLNGKVLTVAMDDGTPFVLSGSGVSSAGHIDVVSGRLTLSGSTTWAGDSANTATVRRAASVAFYNVETQIPWSLSLESDAGLYAQLGDVEASASLNVWAGPVEIVSGRANVTSPDDTAAGVHLVGTVNGDGGFRVSGLAALRLSNPANSFAGGAVLNGSSTSAGGMILDATGALPAESAIANVIGGDKGYVQRVVLAGGNMKIPDVTFSREGMLTNSADGTAAAIGTLSKANNNAFMVAGGVSVTNMFSFSGNGTVSFRGDISPVAGLYMAATNFSTEKATAQAECKVYFGIEEKINNAANARAALTESVLKGMADKMIAELPNERILAPDLAYRAWTTSEAQRFAAYRGCFNHLEPTNAFVTFAVSLADIAAVWIDGDCIVMNVGSKTAPTGSSATTFFLTLGSKELTPGAHEITILLGHVATNSNGPKVIHAGDDSMDWQTDNFGLAWRVGAIDPSAATNAADYVALSNTAGNVFLTVASDGSSLSGSRPFLAAITALPTGNGSLDFGEDSLSVPYDVADLFGTPVISCGALRVTNSWTVAAADVESRPLTVKIGSSVDFTGSTFYGRSIATRTGRTVAVAENGAAIVGVPSLPPEKSRVWHFETESGDSGSTLLKLFSDAGLSIIIK